MAISREKIEGLIVTIQNLYLSDNIPWVIGYSGGKDSTAAVQLVWMALERLPEEERQKQVYIMNTDTLVESPVVSRWVEKSLECMKAAADAKGLLFKPVSLIPEYDNTFWVNLIGRGYPFPRKKYRWCTDRLKIRPVNDFIRNTIAEHGQVILVLGTRKKESSRRNRTMTDLEKKRVRELLSPNPTLANELVFSPMEDWDNDDVWAFLMQYKNPWGYSNTELMTMYRGATADNECPLMVDQSMPSCGKSRFGCWVCTMVEKDKSMEAMISNDREKEWMAALLDFRNEFGNEDGDRERRSFRRMKGNLQGNYGKLFHGPYNKDIREQWLERLLLMQKDINENGPQEFQDLELIRLPELRAIRRIWVNEKHEFEDSLPRIYEKALGKTFEDPEWIHNENFGRDEWEILRKVCHDMYPDEELVFEMMYTLIDIESKAVDVNQKKGILDDINDTLKKTFYKNEEDATKFYYDMMTRKKNYGGKYNEKFLDYQPLASEFEEEEEE